MLAPDASAYLNTTLAASATSADVVKRFVDCVLANPGLESNRVTKSLCEEILSTWQSESESSEEILFLINALDVSYFLSKLYCFWPPQTFNCFLFLQLFDLLGEVLL